MSASSVVFETARGVARVTLDRPPLNVLNTEMLREMEGVLERVADDPEVKLLVLGSRGPGFCAGVDVADHTEDRLDEMMDAFHGVIRRLMAAPYPVVAAVRGAALGGGCELALACDVVLAGADLKLGVPEIQLAVFPPVAAALLPRLVGRQHALDLILTGRTIDADEARALGLVCAVAPADELDARVEEYVERLAGLSRPVLHLTKRTVVEGLELPMMEAFQRAEDRYLDELMALRDPHEGLAAFLEKRSPVWSDA